MDFLLECIGFPPGDDLDTIVEHVREHGEPTPWRGPGGTHLRLPLSEGLELRVERDEGEEFWTVWPYYRSPHRLRVEVQELRGMPDSPFDALLIGTANPDAPEHPDEKPRTFPFCTWLTDARRLPKRLPRGHVLAISAAGFALDVTYVGPNEGVCDRAILDEPRGALFRPIGGEENLGGCMEVSLRIKELKRVRNPLTGVHVDVLETDAPGRPMQLFVSRWQLEEVGLPPVRAGWRIEGTFVFSGRLTGGLPPTRPRRPRTFG